VRGSSEEFSAIYPRWSSDKSGTKFGFIRAADESGPDFGFNPRSGFRVNPAQARHSR